MADYTINIASNVIGLIRAFNLANVRVPDTRDNPYNADAIGQNYQEPDKVLYKSALGTPVFADLTLKGGSYTDQISGRLINFPEIKFASVVITCDFAARIIKTEIQGRDGTIKEYIGQDDAKVSIQGIITGWNGHYPIDEVASLNEWRKAPVSKAVVSTFLQNLGIDNLVVEDFSLPQVAGGYSYQTFTINCISDFPVELKIN